MIVKKFALLPKKVSTWRNSVAIIWMQSYYIEYKTGGFMALNQDDSDYGYPYIDKLGTFSKEF